MWGHFDADIIIYWWLIVSVRALVGGRRQQEQCSQAAEAPRQPRAFAPGVAVVAEVAVAVSTKYQWYLWNILITLFEAVASTTCKSAHQLFPPPCQSLHYFHTDLAAKNTSGGRCESIWQKKTPQGSLLANIGRQYLCWWNREQTTSKTRESWILRKGHLAALKTILSFKCQPQYQWLNLDFLGKKTIRGPNDSFSRTGPGAIDRNIWSPRKAFRRQPFTAPNPALLATICFHTQPFSTLSIHSTRRNCPRAAFSKNTFGFFLCLNLQTQTSLWMCKGNNSW